MHDVPILSINQTLAQTTRTECRDLGGTLTCASAPEEGGGEVLQWRCRIAYFGGNPVEDSGGGCGMSTLKILTTANAAGPSAPRSRATSTSSWLGATAASTAASWSANNDEHTAFIGTSDVRDRVRDSRLWFQVTYSSKTAVGERMGAEGHMKSDEQYKNGTKFEQKADWAMFKHDSSL
ncbi:hypothetical protein MCOR17_002156 [Pyricularia oryzae]|nr:hypothetical protein MCOR17_002156 [Pyricularia oryzae]